PPYYSKPPGMMGAYARSSHLSEYPWPLPSYPSPAFGLPGSKMSALYPPHYYPGSLTGGLAHLPAQISLLPPAETGDRAPTQHGPAYSRLGLGLKGQHPSYPPAAAQTLRPGPSASPPGPGLPPGKEGACERGAACGDGRASWVKAETDSDLEVTDISDSSSEEGEACAELSRASGPDRWLKAGQKADLSSAEQLKNLVGAPERGVGKDKAFALGYRS
ncbi:ETS domain-containing transcription factor ERF-like, partial [Chiloscyllium plagiosum]|uniref:ETS domain-containing transcription factor ERF-like n=1 Tax=Chiloscyllium plagiosum TaxID=36176 RepID=UPI001CB8073B